MDQLAALQDTIDLAEDHEMPERSDSSLGLAHLRSMNQRARAEGFSDAKLGRWLGWAQCAVVAADIGLTLDHMKQINLSHAD